MMLLFRIKLEVFVHCYIMSKVYYSYWYIYINSSSHEGLYFTNTILLRTIMTNNIEMRDNKEENVNKISLLNLLDDVIL